MNFMQGYAFGLSGLLNFTGQLPQARAYNKVTIYGVDSSDINIIDNVHIRDRILTDDEILAINPTVTPIWDGSTILLGTFNNSLNAGTVTNITNPITYFDIYRKKDTDTSFIKIGTTLADDKDFIDITAQPNSNYIYNIVGKNDEEASEPLEGTLESQFFLWALIDEDTFETHVFNFNLLDNGFGNEIAYQRYDGYNKYSTYMFGNRDFLTGGVEAIVSSNYQNIEQSVEYLDILRTFINNGKPKILKSRKGHVLKVITYGYEASPLNSGILQQPYIVKFNFEQVGDVNG